MKDYHAETFFGRVYSAVYFILPTSKSEKESLNHFLNSSPQNLFQTIEQSYYARDRKRQRFARILLRHVKKKRPELRKDLEEIVKHLKSKTSYTSPPTSPIQHPNN